MDQHDEFVFTLHGWPGRMFSHSLKPLFLVVLAFLLTSAVAVGQERRRPRVSNSSTIYIDNAIVGSQIRFRFDAGFGNDRPDRAEAFYAKCGCFRRAGDPRAPGPVPGNPVGGRVAETNIDFQDIRLDLEYAFSERFSAFIELYTRFLNPDVNENTAGVGDMRAGLKYALVASPDKSITFQLRTYIPTGDADRGLGTHHVSLEPALLYFHQLSDRWTLEAELRDWIPIGGSSGRATSYPTQSFAGSILRYGVGLGYRLVGCEESFLRVTPVVELVGWTVLDGLASVTVDGTPATLTVKDASGDTIFNAKIGTRISIGDAHSVHFSYGRALTQDVWYEDIMRLEYRYAF